MITFDDNPARMDIARVHAWLSSSYWSPGITRDLVVKAIRGSHPLGAYRDGEQIGFARAVTDHATFAWIADVWVDQSARGQGVGRGMVNWFIEHPDFAGIRRIALNTLDAHGVYAKLGFTALHRPNYVMERLSADAQALLRPAQ